MDVMIIMGSKSDRDVAAKAAKVLDELGVRYETTIASAHRTPRRVEELVRNTDAKVFIAVAGLSAALPGVIASHTLKPVIGVPVSGKINMDAVLSVLQMPPGIPVGAVGLDNGKNAALLTVEILAISDKGLEDRLKEYRRAMADKVTADALSLESK